MTPTYFDTYFYNIDNLKKSTFKCNFKIISNETYDYILFKNFIGYPINNFHTVSDKVKLDFSYDHFSLDNVIVGIKMNKDIAYTVYSQNSYTNIEFTKRDQNVSYINPYGNALLSYNKFDELVKITICKQ